jgi:hypothetical protein
LLASKVFVVFVLVFGQLLRGLLGYSLPNHPGGLPQKGISYAAWGANDYQTEHADESLSEVQQTGADWISLIVTQYQRDTGSTTIQPTINTPTDASLAHAIQGAHGLGLKVLFKPHVDLSADPDHWRGEIGRGFDAKQWSDWFDSYSQFILHYALLANQNGVDEFCVGTELSLAQARDAVWRKLVGEIRAVFHGPLVYAANFGDEYKLGWWDAVDYIGVDAYYPLTLQVHPSLAALKLSWKAIGLYLAGLSIRENRQILFTEIGYRSMQGAASRPGDYWSSAPPDAGDQEIAYQAVFESVYHQPWFAGMFWWTWEVNPRAGGLEDAGYTPQNKPAEDVIHTWYARPKGG